MQFKKFFAVIPALALSTAMVFAQEPQTQTPTQTDVGQPTDTNEPVFKGCLSGSKDNYTLTASDGKSYRLHSDKDINEHVGKMVEIRGTMKQEGVDRPADAAPASQMSEIDVADIKSTEGSCPADSAAASSEAPKTEASDANAAATSTEAQPSASASASTETNTQPAASAEVGTTSSEPAASAAVSTENQSASVSADTNSADVDASANVDANQATDTTATASANDQQNNQADAAQLPETASPLPLLGLLGFASMGLGLLMRRK